MATTTDQGIRVRELGHLVLFVRDLERSREFYGKILGFPEITGGKSPLSRNAAAFTTGRTHHELLLIEVGPHAAPIPPGRHVGMYHFGLKIGDTDEELRGALTTLREAGVRIIGTSDHTVTHSVYIQDPDGNEIELYVDVKDADWQKDPSLLWSDIKPLQL